MEKIKANKLPHTNLTHILNISSKFTGTGGSNKYLKFNNIIIRNSYFNLKIFRLLIFSPKKTYLKTKGTRN